MAVVGLRPDEAQVLLSAHHSGDVSEYAHRDDTVALPPVKTGQVMQAGQLIGVIGLTGITTGAHLHYAVMKDGGPVDPLSLLTTTPTR